MSFRPSFDFGPGPEMDEPGFSRAASRRTARTHRASTQPSIQLRPPRPPSSVYSRSVGSPPQDATVTVFPGPDDKDSRFVDGWVHPAMRRTTMSSINSYAGLVRLHSEEESRSEGWLASPDSSTNTDGTSNDPDKIISRAGSKLERQLSIGAAEQQGQVSSATASRRKRRLSNWKIAVAVIGVAFIALVIVIVLVATGKIGKSGDASTDSASTTATAEKTSRTTSTLLTSRMTEEYSSTNIDPTTDSNSIPTLPSLSSNPIPTTTAADDRAAVYTDPMTITPTPSRETDPPFSPPLSGLYPPLSRTRTSTKRSVEELIPGPGPREAGWGLTVD